MNKISSSLRLHYWILFFLYFSAFAISFQLLFILSTNNTLIESLSSGAIIATFGSAVATIGTIWCGDHESRVLLNVNILFKDILKQDEQWRRWPFLPRKSTKKTFGDEWLQGDLKNPDINLDVGSHQIHITVPTVQADFFDLGIGRNLYPLMRFRKAAHTKIVGELSSDDCFLSFCKYECLFDIWVSVLIFRIARYVIHFGAALTITSALISAIVIL